MSGLKTIFLFLPKVCYGGQERVVSRLTELLENDANIIVAVLDDSEVVYKISAPIIYVGNNFIKSSNRYLRFFGDFISVVSLSKQLLRKNSIGCVSFGRQADIVNVMSRYLTRKVKHMTSIRGYYTAKNIVEKRTLSKIYSNSDNIICVSKGIERLLQEELGIQDGKVCTIYNPYESDKIYELSGSYRIENNNKFVIVSVGTLKWEKGFWHLLKALYIVQNSYTDVLLQIIGDDYECNKDKLQRLSADLGLEHCVEFVNWQENPFPYIGSSDLFVLPSVSEGFPNALVEAMSCGKAVVAADCMTGPREILSTETSEVEKLTYADYGLLIPALNIEEDYTVNIDEGDRCLAEAILVMKNNESLRKKYGVLAKKRADQFSYNKCRKEYKKILGL